MIVEAPKKLHISDIRKLFIIYTCFDIVTMSSSVESEKTVANFEYKNLEWLTATYLAYLANTPLQVAGKVKQSYFTFRNVAKPVSACNNYWVICFTMPMSQSSWRNSKSIHKHANLTHAGLIQNGGQCRERR